MIFKALEITRILNKVYPNRSRTCKVTAFLNLVVFQDFRDSDFKTKLNVYIIP